MFDIQEIRSQFTILDRQVNGKPLVYLDNAATSQKPNSVLEVCHKYYTELNANVHRGIHTLSQLATEEMELSRRKIQKFINAKHDFEVIFTKGTTEGLNLIAYILTQKLKKTMKLSFLTWSITRISFLGNCFAKGQVQNSALFRWMKTEFFSWIHSMSF
jgi:selenocysteine lyase/cysteine desulfurase